MDWKLQDAMQVGMEERRRGRAEEREERQRGEEEEGTQPGPRTPPNEPRAKPRPMGVRNRRTGEGGGGQAEGEGTARGAGGRRGPNGERSEVKVETGKAPVPVWRVVVVQVRFSVCGWV